MKVGSYTLKSIIGEGAFGRTYYGEHALLGKAVPVCVKQEKTRQEPYMGMFREEAMIIARLRHPSLPCFMDYIEGDEDVGQLLVLSYIEGVPLDKLIEEHGPVTDEHLCWILDRVFGALSYLHGNHNIVHCDIKPGNLIIDIDNHNVTLIDFGMSSLKPNELSLSKGGTPAYMPPEFELGYPPIPASDFYSVGKVALFLTGGDVNSGEPHAGMHLDLRNALLSLIRRDPTQRPQGADLLRDDIHQMRQSLFGSTTTVKAIEYRD